jgi:photosystem II stability/assembly factor-like uncharacterized protein
MQIFNLNLTSLTFIYSKQRISESLLLIPVIILIFLTGIMAATDWTDIGPSCGVTLGVYCHPTEKDIIYLVLDTGHLFRSMNQGDTWQRISQTVALATMPQRQYRGGEHAVAVDLRPGFGHVVYFSPGQDNAGLWRSTDYGSSWSKTQGNDNLGASVIAVDYEGKVICLTGRKTVATSADSGDTWSEFDVPFQSGIDWYKPVGYKIDIEISRNNTIWITNRIEDEGIYFSADLGESWDQKLAGNWIVDLTCSPVDSNIILALEQDGRIFRSTDGGEIFEETGSVQQDGYWTFSTWPPHTGGISINSTGTVIAIGRWSMARSINSGETFTETIEADLDYSAPAWPFIDRKTTDQSLKCCDISASPVDTSFWIFGDGAMRKISKDNGLSWIGGSGSGDHGLWMYGNPYFDATDPNVFHVACVDFGHAYTPDLGKTWITTESSRISCMGVTQDPNNPNIYYKATKSNDSTELGIFKSIDYGHNFTKMTTVALANSTYGGRIFIDPTDSNIIYCTLRGGKGVYRSIDAGLQFTTFYLAPSIHQSAITKSGNVFFHKWNGYGLYRYLKNTDEWKNIATSYLVDGFAVHPKDENIIFMNASGALYKTTNGLDASPVWLEQGTYAGRQIYIDPYKVDCMLMMTDQPGIGMMISQNGGENWETIHGNLSTSFVWGFVPGGPAAKGRVYTFDATASYIDDLYDPATLLEPESDKAINPKSNLLGPAYPNPFNGTTKIPFSVGSINADISLKIYDVTGRKVCTLYEGKKNPGNYSLIWDGKDFQGKSLSSGIFFLEFQVGQQHWMGKLVLLK